MEPPIIDPNANPTATAVTCLSCGYNLTGVVVGGQCPECGTPVSPAFQSAGQRTCGFAITSMVLGIISIPGCMCYAVPTLICGVLAIVFWKLAKTQIASGSYRPASSSMATAGLVCGLVGLGMVLAGVAFIAIVMVAENFG